MGALAIAVLFSLALAAVPAAAQPVAAAEPVTGAFIGPFVTRGAQVDGGRKLVEEFELPDPAPPIAFLLGRETWPLVACTTAEHVYSEEYDDAYKAPQLKELKEEIEEDLRHNGLLGTS